MFQNSIFSLFFVLSSTVALAQPGFTTFRDTFCDNQTVLVVTQFFNASNPAGTVTLPGAAVGGIDSVIQVELVFNPTVEITLTQTLCEGDTLWVNGTPYHAGFYIGEELVDNGTVNGCDSTIYVNLTFRQRYYDFQPLVCEGDSVLVNGTIYSAFDREGEEVFPSTTGGCDSIVRVKVIPIAIPFSVLLDTLCPGGTLVVNGTLYDKANRSGFELLPNAGENGCDSLVRVNVAFRELFVYLGEDTEIIKGDEICIEPLFGLTPIEVVWLPTPPCPDSSCTSNCIVPLNHVSFTVIVTDSTGCVLRDDLRIRVSDKNRVYAPNVFNPDENFPNNRFFLGADRGVRMIRHWFIADRWGEILFEAKDTPPNIPDFGWDGYFRGRVMHPGTYVFWAELERIDGSRFVELGEVSLVR